MRFLGEQVNRRGFTVYAPRLPGHGATVNELAHTRRTQWVDAVTDAVAELRRRCHRVVLVGQSMGGLLALHHAATRPGEVAAVASLAAPLWLEGLGARVARWTAPGGWLHGRVTQLPKLGGPDARDPQTKREDASYDQVPTAALAELMALMATVRAELEQVTVPVLVLHSRHDHTAPVACADELARRTRAERTRILSRSYHLLASDVERAEVAAEVGVFAARHLGDAG